MNRRIHDAPSQPTPGRPAASPDCHAPRVAIPSGRLSDLFWSPPEPAAIDAAVHRVERLLSGLLPAPVEVVVEGGLERLAA